MASVLGGIPVELENLIFESCSEYSPILKLVFRNCTPKGTPAKKGGGGQPINCKDLMQYGSLPLLQWACANGCPCDESTCSNAALEGHLEILQWARANG